MRDHSRFSSKVSQTDIKPHVKLRNIRELPICIRIIILADSNYCIVLLLYVASKLSQFLVRIA